jgi:pimeloyl-ACP methyl ester carboxylesterase
MAINVLLLFSGCYHDDPDGNEDAFFYVNHKGAQMPVLVEGKVESKKFVIIVHGGPGLSGIDYIFDPAIAKLESDFGVVYYDQRLSGSSTDLKVNKTIDEYPEHTRKLYAEDLMAVINTLKFKYGSDINVFLLGHSWGGELIIEFTAEPDFQKEVSGIMHVAGLVRYSDDQYVHNMYLREQVLKICQTEISEGENLSRWQEIYNYFNALDTNNYDSWDTYKMWEYGWDMSWYDLRKEGKLVPQHLEGDYYDGFYNNNEASVSPNLGLKYKWFLSDNPADVLNGMGGYVLNRIDQTNDLPKIIVPTLIITGEYDCVCPPKLGRRMYQNISTPDIDKKYLEMDSISHAPYDKEIDFYNAVYEFVDKY